MKNLQNLLFSNEDGIATITLNRSESLNDMPLRVLKEINLVLGKCKDRDDLRVVILTGSGRAFSSGANVFDFQEAVAKNTIDSLMEEMVDEVNKLVIGIREILKPVLAMVNGIAFGIGFDLLQACDIVFALKSAKFQVGFPRFGLIPDGGGTYFFPRNLPIQKANELIFATEPITAQKAFDLGLVNMVCEDYEDLKEKTREMALKLAKGSMGAFAMTKKLINEGLFHDLERHLMREKEVQVARSLSPDFAKGLAAVTEKIAPR